MAAKILWVSRFAPFGVHRQIETLKRMFGADCEVVHRDIPNSAQVAAEFARGGYADIVCVVHMATLDHICREGIRPLWADMVESQPTDGRKPDLDFRGNMFWFTGYRRVTGVSLDLTAAQPKSAGVRKVLRLTRHRVMAEERTAFQKLYPGVEVIDDDRPFSDGREAIDRFRRSGAGELLVVAPYSVIDQIVKGGVEPLWAEVVGGQFRSLYRVKGVRIDFVEV